LIFKEKQ